MFFGWAVYRFQEFMVFRVGSSFSDERSFFLEGYRTYAEEIQKLSQTYSVGNVLYDEDFADLGEADYV